MRTCILSALVVTAAIVAGVPAGAADTSSLAAFVQSCKDDAKSCRSMTMNAIISARNAKYGCIPHDLSEDKAGDKLYDWLKDTANANPKYQKEALADLMWTGVDELWPCKK